MTKMLKKPLSFILGITMLTALLPNTFVGAYDKSLLVESISATDTSKVDFTTLPSTYLPTVGTNVAFEEEDGAMVYKQYPAQVDMPEGTTGYSTYKSNITFNVNVEEAGMHTLAIEAPEGCYQKYGSFTLIVDGECVADKGVVPYANINSSEFDIYTLFLTEGSHSILINHLFNTYAHYSDSESQQNWQMKIKSFNLYKTEYSESDSLIKLWCHQSLENNTKDGGINKLGLYDTTTWSSKGYYPMVGENSLSSLSDDLSTETTLLYSDYDAQQSSMVSSGSQTIKLYEYDSGSGYAISKNAIIFTGGECTFNMNLFNGQSSGTGTAGQAVRIYYIDGNGNDQLIGKTSTISSVNQTQIYTVTGPVPAGSYKIKIAGDATGTVGTYMTRYKSMTISMADPTPTEEPTPTPTEEPTPTPTEEPTPVPTPTPTEVPSGSSLSFDVTMQNSGDYAVLLYAQCTQSGLQKFSLCDSTDGGHTYTDTNAKIINTQASDNAQAYNLGKIHLSAGKHTLKFTLCQGSLDFYMIALANLSKVNDISSLTKLSSLDFMFNTLQTTDDSNNRCWVQLYKEDRENGLIGWQAHEKLYYVANVQAQGNYNISINGMLTNTGSGIELAVDNATYNTSLTATSATEEGTVATFENIPLTAGTHIISLYIADTYWNGFTSIDFAYQSENDTEISDINMIDFELWKGEGSSIDNGYYLNGIKKTGTETYFGGANISEISSPTSDVSDMPYALNFANGQTYEFTAFAPKESLYDISLLNDATGSTSASYTMNVNGTDYTVENVNETASTAYTKSNAVSLNQIKLNAGENTIKITRFNAEETSTNIAKITFNASTVNILPYLQFFKTAPADGEAELGYYKDKFSMDLTNIYIQRRFISTNGETVENEGEKPFVVAAAYDENGYLITVNFVQRENATDAITGYSFEMTSEAETVKGFLFEDMGSMKPLKNAVVLKRNTEPDPTPTPTPEPTPTPTPEPTPTPTPEPTPTPTPEPTPTPTPEPTPTPTPEPTPTPTPEPTPTPTPTPTPEPTPITTTYKIECEKFSSIAGGYYLVNNSGWYGTIDFSNNEALQINSAATVTYNVTNIPAGTYAVKLYGGNIVAEMPASVNIDVNGNTYTVNTPEIGGIGQYNYDNVVVSNSVVITGDDTITVTCNDINWAGIDYIEFVSTTSPTPTPTIEPSTPIRVEAENFSSISGVYYLINESGWFGTLDFSNNEAIDINKNTTATYNITSVPSGTYAVKLYGGNITADTQATVIVTINGNAYTVNTPEIGGMGNYNYDNVVVSSSVAMTGNDTVTITCNNSNWAGIDYIEFTSTATPTVTPTPIATPTPEPTPTPTATPTLKPSTPVIVEGENFSSIVGGYYLVNGSGWYGTINFSNNEAIQINKSATITYNLTSVPSGNYVVKLYGGNITADTQATVIVTINGNAYTINTPEIGGIGQYNYDNVLIANSVAMTGNDTVTITCNNSNWAGIDYIKFTSTDAPTPTPTPEPETGDKWTVTLSVQDHMLLNATNLTYHFTIPGVKDFTITNHESPKTITVPYGTTAEQMKKVALSADTSNLATYGIKADESTKTLTIPFYIGSASDFNPEVSGKNVHLFGDSLCAHNGYMVNSDNKLLNFPRQGWGKEIRNYLYLDSIGVDNLGVSGATSESYKTAYMGNNSSYPRAMDWANSRIKSGDYVIINFGVNDCTAIYRQGSMTLQQYKDNLKYYCDYAKGKGATPILVSSPTEFYSVGDITGYTSNHYTQLRVLAATMQEVATTEGVDFIDLNQTLANDWLLTNGSLDNDKIVTNRNLYGLSATAISAMQTKYSSIFSGHIQDASAEDDLHLNLDGANHVASRMTELMKNAGIGFAQYIK